MQKNRARANTTFALLILIVLLSTALIGGVLVSVFSGARMQNSGLNNEDITSSERDYNAPGGLNPDGTVFNVKKVTINTADGSLVNPNTPTLPQDSFIVLSTDDNPAATTRQAVHIDFGVTGSSVEIFSIDIKLNGANVRPNEFSEASGGTGRSFSQNLFGIPSLSETTIADGDPMKPYYTYNAGSNTARTEVEGRYTVEFKYRKHSGGTVEAEETLTFSFYLVTENTYNVQEQFNMLNTVQVVNIDDTRSHYFNFNNFYESDGTLKTLNGAGDPIENEDFTQLDYPTITYNPEKFKISYTRTLYSITETVTLSFRTSTNGQTGYIDQSVSLNGAPAVITTITIGNKINDSASKFHNQFKAEIAFDAVGTYKFSKQVLIKQGTNNYLTLPNTSIVGGTETMTKQEELTSYGFASLYSKNGNENAPFYDNTYYDGRKTVSDITFANYGLVTGQPASSVNKPSNISVATTNQGPVLFDFFFNAGSDLYSEDSLRSYYEHTSLAGVSSGAVDIKNKSIRFSESGTYTVVFVYKNPIYNESKPTGSYAKQKYFQQVFNFTIRSDPPAISIRTDEEVSRPIYDLEKGEALGSGAFTKQDVWVQFAKEGPFDSTIKAYVRYKEFGAAAYGTQTLFTPFTYKDDGVTKTPLNPDSFKIFSDEGHYQIIIYHTNSDKVYSTYSFTIDKTPISGAAALKIEIGNNAFHLACEDETATVLAPVVLSSQTDFNLLVSDNFGFTWNNKASGATIYANYVYAPLSAIPAFTGSDALTEGAEMWLTTNAQFSPLTAPVAYSKINPVDHLFLHTDKPVPVSKVFSQDMFVLLLLRDAAGNVLLFPVIREKVKPAYLRTDEDGNAAEASTDKDTVIIWGSHKAISIIPSIADMLTDEGFVYSADYAVKKDEQLNIFNSLKTYIRKSGADAYVVVPITEISAEGSDDASTNVDIPIFTATTANPITTICSATILVLIEPSGNYVQLKWGDGINQKTAKLPMNPDTDIYLFAFRVSDARRNITYINQEINLDKSKGSMRTYTGSFYEPGLDDASVSQTRSTNRQFIGFRWQDKGDLFTIGTIVMNFYPLIYDDQTLENTETFPYKATPSITRTLYDINDPSLNSASVLPPFNNMEGLLVLFQTLRLNLSFSSSFSDNIASAPGKYEIVRTYDNLLLTDAELGGDKLERHYSFYIDRNKPISNVDRTLTLPGEDDPLFDTYKIGEDTNLQIGGVGGSKFTNFSRTTTNTFAALFDPEANVNVSDFRPAITTNKLPLFINSYLNKYHSDSLISDALAFANINRLISMQLCAVVQFTDGGNSAMTQSFYMCSSNKQLTDLFKSNAFTKIGYYDVILFDLSNYNNIIAYSTSGTEDFYARFDTYLDPNFAPNHTIFKFRIVGIPPEATYQHKAEELSANSYVTLEHTGSTKEKHLRITFEEPADEYTAKIAADDVKVTLTVVNPLTGQRTGREVTLNTYQTLTEGDPLLNTYPAEITDPAGLASFSVTDLRYYRVPIASSSPVRYRYYILMPPTTLDCEFSVFVHYEGAREFYKIIDTMEYRNYENAFVANIDHTPPQKNLISIIEKDTYLTAAEKTRLIENIKLKELTEADKHILKNYAFAVSDPRDGSLTPSIIYYDSLDTFSGGFWYRAYDKKYDDTPNDAQTVVPGDPAYGTTSGLQFSPTSAAFVQVPYGQLFYNDQYGLKNSEGKFGGYFDIIERDNAGNYRVYTLFVDSPDGKLSTMTLTADSERGEFNVINSAVDKETTMLLKSSDSTTITVNSVSSAGVVFNNLGIFDAWYTLTYRDISTSIPVTYQALKQDPTTPNKSIAMWHAEILGTINALLSTASSPPNAAGYCYEFTLTNRFGSNFSFRVCLPGEKGNIQFTTGYNSFTAAIPNNTVSTQYLEFEAYVFYTSGSGNSWVLQQQSSAPGGMRYVFNRTNSTYRFVLVDNFGRRIVQLYDFGVTDTCQLKFSSTPVLAENMDNELVNHTSDKVELVVNAGRYILATVNVRNQATGLPVNATGLYTESTRNGLTTYTFTVVPNSNYSYNLDVRYNTSVGEEESFPQRFVIYSVMPEVKFLDIDFNDVWKVGQERITSKAVTVRWNDENMLFTPRATIRVNNGDARVLYSGQTFSEDGNYEVVIQNDLGNLLRYVFTIREAEVSVYGVFKVNSGVRTAVSAITELLRVQFTDSTEASPNKDLSIQNHVYLKAATTTLVVEVNDDKNLSLLHIATLGNTTIYKVYGTTTHIITRYFAVTSVTYPTDGLQKITSYQLNNDTMSTGSSKRIYPTSDYTGKTTFSWYAQYTDISNSLPVYKDFFFVDLMFNGTYAGSFNAGGSEWGALVLTEAGEYRVYIRDPAGREQRFDTSPYYTIIILTQMHYRVNNQTGIQGAVYNGSVEFQLMQIEEYVASSISVTVLKNKVPQTITSATSRLVFREPGFYEISMSADLRNATGALPITNYVSFIILNPDETRLCYEFTPMSGYEITRVMKAGDDITEQVRQAQSEKTGLTITTLRTFFASIAEYGIGTYTVTVEIAAHGYIPLQTFTFTFKINDERPIITSSEPFGASTTKVIRVTLNPNLIYSQVGECTLYITNFRAYEINAESPNREFNYYLSQPDEYFVQIYNTSGNLITSYHFTVKVPLGTMEIILIVIGSLAVVGVTITFIILRTRMRVR